MSDLYLVILHNFYQRKTEELRLKVPEMRQYHLKQQLKLTREREDEDSVAAILCILHDEAHKKFWRRVHCKTLTKQGQPCSMVWVQIEDGVETYNMEEEMFGQVRKTLDVCFWLAFVAPCNKTGPLFLWYWLPRGHGRFSADT